jgi:hypothetical protein
MAEDASTPEELALRGFKPEDEATVVSVDYRHYDPALIAQYGDLGHAVVQVGFPGRAAYYYISAYHYPGGWRLDMPPEGDPRRRTRRLTEPRRPGGSASRCVREGT